MGQLVMFAVLLAEVAAPAADLAKLPANTWVEIKYATDQPSDAAEKGRFARQGWNKLVYDPDGKRVLFYDRWIDKKHGGYTIYGNCLFGFDPAAARLTPIQLDHWTKTDHPSGGYRTVALPENDRTPTPAPRHVYHAFEYVSELKSVFLCNGANQTVLDKQGKLVGHDACDGMWRLDMRERKWTQLASERRPANLLDDAMAYCPDTKSLVYVSGHSRQVWLFDLAKGEFRQAKQSPPRRGAGGVTVAYDPTKRRMIVAGGGPLEGQFNQAKSPALREVYAFDPGDESVQRLADCPTALYEAHLAYDPRHKVFVTAAMFPRKDQPSGLFAYDPLKDAWREILSVNEIPSSKSWFAWLQLCYDSRHECFIGKLDERFFAFRYQPTRDATKK